MHALNDKLKRVTDRIIKRSEKTRSIYLANMAAAKPEGPARSLHGCSNQAHAYAAIVEDQAAMVKEDAGNLGIVTAYNCLLYTSPSPRD